MSIDMLRSAFEAAQQVSNWSIQLLKITSTKQDGTKYDSRQIQLEPIGKLDSTLSSKRKRIFKFLHRGDRL